MCCINCQRLSLFKGSLFMVVAVMVSVATVLKDPLQTPSRCEIKLHLIGLFFDWEVWSEGVITLHS